MRKLLLPTLLLLAFAGTIYADPIMTPTTSATTLVNAILGPGVTLIGAPTLIGVTNQQATFTGGLSSIGFDAGIVLTSGNATAIPGANISVPETLGLGGSGNDSLSYTLGTAGDPVLSAIAGYPTYDANVLSFQFQFGDGTSTNNNLYFNFVFASEEYLDYVNSQFNDVFGFFLDGNALINNIGIVPGDGPITVNNVNPLSQAAYYINNVPNTNGYPVAGLPIKYDGLTTVIQASATGLGAGTHTISFKVADGSDYILDAGVFIQAGTFSTIPEPTSLLLLGVGLGALGLAAFRRSRR